MYDIDELMEDINEIDEILEGEAAEAHKAKRFKENEKMLHGKGSATSTSFKNFDDEARMNKNKPGSGTNAYTDAERRVDKHMKFKDKLRKSNSSEEEVRLRRDRNQAIKATVRHDRKLESYTMLDNILDNM